jgi:hypothetical protein
VDVWTGATVHGGQVLPREVPLDVVPVYARAQAWAEGLSEVFGD